MNTRYVGPTFVALTIQGDRFINNYGEWVESYFKTVMKGSTEEVACVPIHERGGGRAF